MSEVKAVCSRLAAEVRTLGIAAGLFEIAPELDEEIVTMTALLVLRDRLIEYNEAGKCGGATFAPPKRVRSR